MIVISRDNRGDAERTSFEDALAGVLAQRDAVQIVPHLYHLREDDPLWQELAALPGPLTVFSWLHPRPAECLLRHHGIDDAAAVCMAAHGAPEECAEQAPAGTPGPVRELQTDTADRWYPVLDESRCIHCGQCHEFCLFGVYERDAAGKVTVAQPDHCKPGCPACSRICPRGAIVFPLYDKDDAIAGAPGRFAAPDDDARKLFERRTRRPHRLPAADAGLDQLIDDLDRRTQGRK